jgi:anaerobic selenocysteine-containing dehydrogenase
MPTIGQGTRTAPPRAQRRPGGALAPAARSDDDAPVVERDVVSFCRICNAMCGVVVTVDDDQVVRVRGDAEHPLSRGYTCPKGRALGAFHHHPGRLDAPERRRGGPVGPLAWPEATAEIAGTVARLVEAHGPDTIGMYLASGSAFDAAGRRAAERFLRVLGSSQKYTATTVDTPCKPLVAELVGGWSGLTPIWDSERSRLLLLIGSNPVVSHGHSNAIPDPVTRLRDLRRGGGELWVVDPRRTETAALADRHLAARPGSDHVLLGHLVRELLRDGADRAYLDAHASGIDELRAAVEPFDAATTAERTGIATTDLADLLSAIRRAGRIAALTGTGTSMALEANVTEWLLWALHVVTGSSDRPGGMWFNPGYLMQLDQRDWAPSDGTPGPGPASRPELPRRFDEYPCAGLVSEIEAGNITALFVVGGNPMCALPDAPRLARALESLELCVVVDVIDTDTTALATHVLPAAGQLERADVPFLLDAYQLAVATQYTPAVLPPVAQRRPVWRIFADLGDALGRSVLPRGVDGATATDDDVLASLMAGSRGGHDAVLAARHGTVHEGATFGWVTERVLPEGRFRLAPAPLLAQLADVERLARAPLVLVPRRQLRTMNSQLRDTAAPGGRVPEVEIVVSPADALARGVASGDEVRLRSEHGEVTGRALVDERIAPGAVSLTHGWTDPNVCVLTSAEVDVDPLTGMVRQSGLPVELERTG